MATELLTSCACTYLCKGKLVEDNQDINVLVNYKEGTANLEIKNNDFCNFFFVGKKKSVDIRECEINSKDMKSYKWTNEISLLILAKSGREISINFIDNQDFDIFKQIFNHYMKDNSVNSAGYSTTVKMPSLDTMPESSDKRLASTTAPAKSEYLLLLNDEKDKTNNENQQYPLLRPLPPIPAPPKPKRCPKPNNIFDAPNHTPPRLPPSIYNPSKTKSPETNVYLKPIPPSAKDLNNAIEKMQRIEQPRMINDKELNYNNKLNCNKKLSEELNDRPKISRSTVSSEPSNPWSEPPRGNARPINPSHSPRDFPAKVPQRTTSASNTTLAQSSSASTNSSSRFAMTKRRDVHLEGESSKCNCCCSCGRNEADQESRKTDQTMTVNLNVNLSLEKQSNSGQQLANQIQANGFGFDFFPTDELTALILDDYIILGNYAIPHNY